MPDPREPNTTSNRLQRLELQSDQHTEKLDNNTEKLDEVLRVLKGYNGVPGLLARVTHIETTERDCPIGRINDMIFGKIDDRPGLLERIRNIERFLDKIEKLSMAMLSAVLIDVVLRVLIFVYKP